MNIPFEELPIRNITPLGSEVSICELNLQIQSRDFELKYFLLDNSTKKIIPFKKIIEVLPNKKFITSEEVVFNEGKESRDGVWLEYSKNYNIIYDHNLKNVLRIEKDFYREGQLIYWSMDVLIYQQKEKPFLFGGVNLKFKIQHDLILKSEELIEQMKLEKEFVEENEKNFARVNSLIPEVNSEWLNVQKLILEIHQSTFNKYIFQELYNLKNNQ